MAEQLPFRTMAESKSGDRSHQTGRVEASTLLLPSSAGAASAPWTPGAPETLQWQVLAHALAWACLRGQVLLRLEKWLRLVGHAAPLPSHTSEFYRPSVTGTAIPSKQGLGSLVGQLLRLLPQLWLLLEEVKKYWRGRSHEHLFLVKNRGH